MNLNINKDDSNINDFLYCWDVFKKRPNKVLLHNTYLSSAFMEITSYKQENTFTEIIPSDDNYIINDKSLLKVSDNIYISYVVIDKLQENSIISEVTFFYKESDDLPKIETIINEVESAIIDFEEESTNKLNTVSINDGILDIEPIEYEIDLDNIELFYNSKTFKEVNKLIKSIKKKNNSINLFFGERGTGKTGIVKYLASKLDRVIIYIPNNMIESTLSSPEFNKFLKRFNKPIVLIDDCELLFNDIFSSSNVMSNNILQMVEGLNSNDLSFIMIYNSKDNEIDNNILSSNELMSIIEFNYLEIHESNDLSKHLGNKRKYKNKSRLIDIIRNNNRLGGNKIGLF